MASAWQWAMHDLGGNHPEKLTPEHCKWLASALDIHPKTVLSSINKTNEQGEPPAKPGLAFVRSPINRYGLYLLTTTTNSRGPILPLWALSQLTGAPLNQIEKLAAEDPEKLLASYSRARLAMLGEILEPLKLLRPHLSQTSLHILWKVFEEETARAEEAKARKTPYICDAPSQPAIAVGALRRLVTMRAAWLEHSGMGHDVSDRLWRTEESAAQRAATRHRARRGWLDEHLGHIPTAAHLSAALSAAGLTSYRKALDYGDESSARWLALEIFAARGGVLERYFCKGVPTGSNWAPLIEHINADGKNPTAGVCVDATHVFGKLPLPCDPDCLSGVIWPCALFSGEDPTHPEAIQWRNEQMGATFYPAPWAW
jgi:hypothetical protein